MKTLRLPNDCGVVTIQKLLDISYQEARQLCFLQGFSSTSGIPTGAVEMILEQKGFQLKHLSTSKTTLEHVSKMLDPEKDYVIEVQRHIMAQIKGVLHNVAGTEKRIVKCVYEVYRK